MTEPGDQNLPHLLADLSGSAGQRGLLRTLATLKAPKPKASFNHICELGTLAGEIVDRLDAAETARAAQMDETAEDSYAHAIDLMVELKFQSAAQPGRGKLVRPARAAPTGLVSL
ncbi:MAG: hypothetical protein GY948_07740 [Alphaproteobacteria bacterium]|nr:hypothetical protein [Alphaproteobacteria bacterium]